jgi:hypothetical protein
MLMHTQNPGNPPREEAPMLTIPTPADVRAALARHRVHRFQVAPRVRIHPVRLGRMLNERLAMPPEVAERLLRAIEEVAAEQAKLQAATAELRHAGVGTGDLTA